MGMGGDSICHRPSLPYLWRTPSVVTASHPMLKAIEYAENYRRVDVCIAVLGVCFLFLAFFIYPS
jgi:hypothetical protein